MVTLVVASRPPIAALFLQRIEGPVHLLIPAETGHLWRAAGVDVPLHPVASWTDYNDLAAVVAKLPVTRVIGTDELTVAAAGFLRSLLGLPGQSWDQAVAFTDKAVMKRRLREGGVPVARWAVAHSFAEAAQVAAEIGWPVVVKPRRGFCALGTTKVTSARQLDEFVAAGKFDGRVPAGDSERMLQASGVYDGLTAARDGFLVERCIDVDAEFSCDIVVWQGEPYLTLTTQYPVTVLEAIDTGNVWEGIALPDDDPAARAVRALTLRAIEVMGLTSGQVHCEIFRTRAGDFVLGEIACRAGGAALPLLSEILFGVNTIRAGVDIAVDREPPRARARTHRFVAVVGVPLASGQVRKVPAQADLENLPGVLRADVRVHEGDVYGGGLGSIGAAAYLFIEANSVDPIAARMREIRAAVEPMFVVDDLERDLSLR
ncbi:ATP-grasp domain-containing protein [Nocardia sp. NBC_01730]|uniref:ATP-grasp domain-containing protein n=1 Tax=Nocardia sp. NBC_01730 TaxID=2975998 RepID=UPI002E13D1ED|nr:ATP-grasp domain-containing protein [Nocardia sp. NBC_01730]